MAAVDNVVTVPYLQIDLPNSYAAEVKATFASEFAALYARAMETQLHVPSSAFRDLGSCNLVRLQDGAPDERR